MSKGEGVHTGACVCVCGVCTWCMSVCTWCVHGCMSLHRCVCVSAHADGEPSTQGCEQKKFPVVFLRFLDPAKKHISVVFFTISLREAPRKAFGPFFRREAPKHICGPLFGAVC